ncbi:MAG: hypothetical protein HOP10_10990 [Chitinophagaceae bacterium]|nr:hypothetical protein [Chitinophagaceae bacterium]
MKYLLALLLVPFLTANECGKNKTKAVPETENEQQVKDSIPACVRALIGKEPMDAPVQIDAYLYKEKKVYLFTAQCCDQYNMLYDDNCKAICAPSGGFTGSGDGKCKDFDSIAKHVKLIWREPSK